MSESEAAGRGREDERGVHRTLWCQYCEQFTPHDASRIVLLCGRCLGCGACGRPKLSPCEECRAAGRRATVAQLAEMEQARVYARKGGA